MMQGIPIQQIRAGSDTTRNDRIRVVLADSDPISRHVLGDVLRSSKLIHLVASVDGRGSAKEWPVEQSDVVVLSAGPPAASGHVMDELVATGARVVLIDSHWTRAQLTSAIVGGAAGCLVKKVEVAYLVPAVVAVMSGNMVLSRELAALHVSGYWANGHATPGQRTRDRLGALTSREREVLSLLAGGMTTAEVAAALRISPTTVKSHVSHSLPKLDVRNRMEAVLLAQRLLALPE